MRLLTLFFVILSFSYNSQAQVTVSGRYVTNNSDVFDLNYGFDQALNKGFEVGLGYWFRLKNKRLEFTPEVSYTFLSGSSSDVTGSSINFNSNILIYALDFHSDCDACPTFSKEGGLIKKGFHWIVNPSVSRVNSTNTENTTPSPNPIISEFDFTTWRLGLGAGLDIGVTNLLTLSPFAMIHFGGTQSIEVLAPETDFRYRQVHIGVRLSLIHI